MWPNCTVKFVRALKQLSNLIANCTCSRFLSRCLTWSVDMDAKLASIIQKITEFWCKSKVVSFTISTVANSNRALTFVIVFTIHVPSKCTALLTKHSKKKRITQNTWTHEMNSKFPVFFLDYFYPKNVKCFVSRVNAIDRQQWNTNCFRQIACNFCTSVLGRIVI